LIFIDEPALNTKMARLYGRRPKGRRCIALSSGRSLRWAEMRLWDLADRRGNPGFPPAPFP